MNQADYYDKLIMKKGNWRPVCGYNQIANLVYDNDYDPENHGKRKLLDMGCGTGEFLSLVQDRYDCHGVDVSPVSVLKSSITAPKAKVFRGEIETFSANEKYDVITCLGVLEHTQMTHSLNNIREQMAPFGQFVCVVPNKKFPLAGTEQAEQKEELLTLEDWTKLFTMHGFYVQDIKKDMGLGSNHGFFVWNTVKVALGILPLSLTYQFVFILSKKPGAYG